jgi:hypothetical protein
LINKEYDISYDGNKWKAKVKNVTNRGNCYEIRIESRSGLTIIVGQYSAGWFVCIPGWNAGAGLSCHLGDTFYNTEVLTEAIGVVDGVTVAQVLAQIAKELNL